MKKQFANSRLSKFVIPETYEITVRPDFETFVFTGEEVIFMSVQKPAVVLTMHSLHLEITDAYWISGKQRIAPTKISYDLKKETASFHFAKKIKGNGKLYLSFRGILNDALHGFYKSSYTHKKKTHYIATTQFEATDARRAFPCFDEPAHKAIFDVTMIVPSHMAAISNTVESSSSHHSPGHKIVKFASTPKMSTYLLAFIVGDFEKIQSKSKNGTIVRIFTPPGGTKHGKFALDVAKRGLDFLNDFFAIKYPLPVLDMIAIPDFSAAAMENWGAVTFRESALLIDEKHTPFVNRQRAAEVILHELVHQWFGNLVTMEWWTHLWLNESFATYMAYVAMDHLFPQWNIWTRFVLVEQSRGLLLDSLSSTHPIKVEVHHPDQIGQIFDDISYRKGASILRMLSSYIGEQNFRDGLRYYLKKHSYKNTSSVHLWEAFEKVSDKPVRKFMHTWVSMPGYPLVRVRAEKNKLYFTQNKFAMLGKKSKQLWQVPIQSQLSHEEVSTLYELRKAHGAITIKPDSEFIKLNTNEHGFYRTEYDPSLLAKLFLALRDKKLSAIDQLGLIRNQFQLSKAGNVSVNVYLEMLRYLKDYNSYVAWLETSNNLLEIESTLLNHKDKALFNDYAQQLFAPLVKVLGWNAGANETTKQTLLRSIALLNAAHYQNKAVIKQAKKLFEGFIKGKALNPDLKMVVLAITASNGRSAEYDKIRSLFDKAILQEEKNRYAQALLMFKSVALQKKTLKLFFSKAVRNQELPILLQNGMADPNSRNIVWQEIQKNWSDIVSRYPDKLLLSKFIKGTEHFTTLKDYKKVKTFFKTHSHRGTENSVASALEQIAINIQWVKNDAKAISRYLNQPESHLFK